MEKPLENSTYGFVQCEGFLQESHQVEHARHERVCKVDT